MARNTPPRPAPPGTAALTVAEAAHELRLSTGHTYTLIRRGELPAVRLPGGTIRVARHQLAAWLDQQTPTTPDGDQ